MAAAVTDRTRVVIVCTPNNPTGPAVTQAELDAFLDRIPDHVVAVVDEAYVEFVRMDDPVDGLATLAEQPNVVLFRTFSKAYGLAGFRVGYAVAQPDVAAALRAVSLPFGVSAVAQAAAIASLEAEAELLRAGRRPGRRARPGRRRPARRGLGRARGPGQLLLVRASASGTADFAAAADERGIVVRPFAGEGCRVSVGEVEANDRLLGASCAETFVASRLEGVSVKVALTHRTTYDFARPVEVGPHVVRLRPAPHCRTPIEAYSLEVTPKDHFLNWQQDPFGNWMARLVFPEKVSTLEITVGLVADLMVINPFDFFIEEYAERFPFAYEPTLAADLAPYLRPVDDSDGHRGLARGAAGAAGGRAPRRCSSSSDLNAAVHRDVAYDVRMEPGVQTPDETLAPPDRLVPGQRVAAGQPAPAVRPGRPVRLRLPGPARPGRLRHRGERRPDRADAGLHRPARLDRGLPPRRRVGRHGPDQRAVRRRGPHPAERDPAPEQRRADRGRDRAGRGHVRLRQRGHPGPRGPAGHRALHRRPVGPHRRARRGGRRPARRRATSG